tara:strand:+ start:1223 stop:1399 length:177 start_codon:yes stop_codon:yes gene_type:complete
MLQFEWAMKSKYVVVTLDIQTPRRGRRASVTVKLVGNLGYVRRLQVSILKREAYSSKA